MRRCNSTARWGAGARWRRELAAASAAPPRPPCTLFLRAANAAKQRISEAIMMTATAAPAPPANAPDRRLRPAPFSPDVPQVVVLHSRVPPNLHHDPPPYRLARRCWRCPPGRARARSRSLHALPSALHVALASPPRSLPPPRLPLTRVPPPRRHPLPPHPPTLALHAPHFLPATCLLSSRVAVSLRDQSINRCTGFTPVQSICMGFSD